MKLPESFVQEIRSTFSQFGRSGETEAFFEALQQKPAHGARANTLKISASELRLLLAGMFSISPGQLPPVPWSDDGFYYPRGLQPGRLSIYAAGLFYIQEPSAMLPAMVLDAKPGERVLDLCAAPGGKSLKIAAGLHEEGLLWANDISHDRTRALLRNLELAGCRNIVMTSEAPERLARLWPEEFDKIMVDAPCSGTGMFRRDPAAVGSWLTYGSDYYAPLQRDILRQAWTMLKPGGRLVYSTCSFSLAEDEAVVSWLASEHDDCQIEPVSKEGGISDGFPLTPEMSRTARIWPHLASGEGHFCALLSKSGNPVHDARPSCAELRSDTIILETQYRGNQSLSAEKAAAVFLDFCRDNLSDAGILKMDTLIGQGRLFVESGRLHLLPAEILPARLVKMKTGVFAGQIAVLRDGRCLFEPSQAFLLALDSRDFRCPILAEPGSSLVDRYLRGETLSLDAAMPTSCGQYVPILIEGLRDTRGNCSTWPLGWTKLEDSTRLKNLYPKAWRKLV